MINRESTSHVGTQQTEKLVMDHVLESKAFNPLKLPNPNCLSFSVIRCASCGEFAIFVLKMAG